MKKTLSPVTRHLSPVTRHASAILIALYAVLAIAASSQAYLLKVDTTGGANANRTKYNNYVIFRQSHFHLLEGKNLYQAYPEEHWDLYKYSPAFALFFGGFARLPDWLGLTLWNLLNVAVFVVAILLLPALDLKKRQLVLLLCAVEAMTSLQNSQSNVLVAGLLILALALLERGRMLTATLCLVATFYIKIFGIVALVMLLLYPGKRRSIPCALFWLVLFGLIPAVVTGFGPLMQSYLQYLDMLRNDQSVSVGFSVMGWLKSWFGLDTPKTVLALAGLALTGLPLLRFSKFTEEVPRYLFFSALLVWMVIFNHKAESPTFIIAVSGIMIWYVTAERSVVNTVLLFLVIVFTSLAPTDIFPFSVRAGLFEPYVIKAVPCILAWIWILFDLFGFKKIHEANTKNTKKILRETS